MPSQSLVPLLKVVFFGNRVTQFILIVQDRVRYEADALREQHRLCPQHVPAVYHFDAKNALIVMQYLPPPHVILRKSITQACTQHFIHLVFAAQANLLSASPSNLV